MKFYETTLETVKVLAINDEEFTLRKMNEDGNVGVVLPGDTRPKIFRSLEEARKVVDTIGMVVYKPEDTYAKAFEV